MSLLSPDTRQRFAVSAAALMAMPELYEAISAEVEATFAEHATLPRTEQARRILWGLAPPHISQAASAADSTPERRTKKA